jgi:putative ABC transport system permease protein
MMFLAEGLAIARSQRSATLTTSLVVATVCAAVLLTAGLAAANEARVLATIDNVDARTILVSDPTADGNLYADTIPILRGLDGVELVIGLGPASDVRNVFLKDAGEPVPARVLWGDLPDDFLTAGRLAEPGEALAGEGAATKLQASMLTLFVRGSSDEAAVVGHFRATGTLQFLNNGVLVIPRSTAIAGDPATLQQMVVRARRLDDVDWLASRLRALVHADDPARLAIDANDQLIELRSVLSSQLGTDSRRLMVALLAIGLAIVAITQVGAVTQRRRDFGRRRALGASRSTIVVLVIMQTGVGSLIGAVLGSAIGSAAAFRIGGLIPPSEFVVGVALLTFIASLVAAIPPAGLAARSDPVRILRVP